eukprot:SAG11_NODE_4521_length_1865_cov_2.355606_2_plen_94_part_00
MSRCGSVPVRVRGVATGSRRHQCAGGLVLEADPARRLALRRREANRSAECCAERLQRPRTELHREFGRTEGQGNKALQSAARRRARAQRGSRA